MVAAVGTTFRSCRARASFSLRPLLAIKPKWRMRWKPPGNTCNKLASARAATKVSSVSRPTNWVRPTMDRLKDIVAEAFMREPKVAMAFRDGKKQTEEDLATVYDDLVKMGVIQPESHGD